MPQDLFDEGHREEEWTGKGIALTYENVRRAVDAWPKGGEPLAVEDLARHFSLIVDPSCEPGKMRWDLASFSCTCHPSDEAEVKEACVGAIFQLHRERYGIYGEA